MRMVMTGGWLMALFLLTLNEIGEVSLSHGASDHGCFNTNVMVIPDDWMMIWGMFPTFGNIRGHSHFSRTLMTYPR